MPVQAFPRRVQTKIQTANRQQCGLPSLARRVAPWRRVFRRTMGELLPLSSYVKLREIHTFYSPSDVYPCNFAASVQYTPIVYNEGVPPFDQRHIVRELPHLRMHQFGYSAGGVVHWHQEQRIPPQSVNVAYTECQWKQTKRGCWMNSPRSRKCFTASPATDARMELFSTLVTTVGEPPGYRGGRTQCARSVEAYCCIDLTAVVSHRGINAVQFQEAV